MRVRVLTPLRHGGRRREAGAFLLLDEAEAAALAARGLVVAEPEPPLVPVLDGGADNSRGAADGGEGGSLPEAVSAPTAELEHGGQRAGSETPAGPARSGPDISAAGSSEGEGAAAAAASPPAIDELPEEGVSGTAREAPGAGDGDGGPRPPSEAQPAPPSRAPEAASGRSAGKAASGGRGKGRKS